jgi:hypothetical protein
LGDKLFKTFFMDKKRNQRKNLECLGKKGGIVREHLYVAKWA